MRACNQCGADISKEHGNRRNCLKCSPREPSLTQAERDERRRLTEERRANRKRLDAELEAARIEGTPELTALNRYGLTPHAWKKLFEKQGRRCALCKKTESGRKNKSWATDHDHKGPRISLSDIRGILCYRCNLMVGYLGDTKIKVVGNFVRIMKYLQETAPENAAFLESLD